MYLLYLDESGTHGASPTFVLAGLAIHEQDAWHLKQRLENALAGLLPAGFRAVDLELHATDINSPRARHGTPSPWQAIHHQVRLRVLHGTYDALARYQCVDPSRPVSAFGVVVDKAHYPDHEQRAYEEILHRFDEMLNRRGCALGCGAHERGVIVHDRRAVEPDVQRWADRWRQVAGRIGRLSHLAEVPLFTDSRASRLVQASDFVTWALWRYYGLPQPDTRWISRMWPLFDGAAGVMHGLAHITPAYRTNVCTCPPCLSRRLEAAAAAR
ncbi:MAG TPA: DUF3800 domain-containing protein [Polyangia bacterium]|jgi:hypothetical protein